MERGPTLCEINYNTLDYETLSREDIHTPFRHRSYRAFSPEYSNRPRANDLFSDNFYEPVTYGCRTPPNSSALLPQCPTSVKRSYTAPLMKLGATDGGVTRSNTTVSFYQGPNGQKSNITSPRVHTKNRKERARTAPLSQIRESVPYRPSGLFNKSLPAFTDADLEEAKGDKVTWVPALNSWISDKSQNPAPYLNFCNAANLSDRGISYDKFDRENVPILPCDRYLAHMKMQSDGSRMAAYLREQQLEEERRRRRERAEAKLAALEEARLRALQAAEQRPPKPKIRFERPKQTPIIPPVQKPPPRPPSPVQLPREPEPKPKPPPPPKKVPLYKSVVKEEPKPKTPPPPPPPKKEPPPPPPPQPKAKPRKSPPPKPAPPPREPSPPPPPPPPKPPKKVEPPPTILKTSPKPKRKVVEKPPPKKKARSKSPPKKRVPPPPKPKKATKKKDADLPVPEPITVVEEVSEPPQEPEPSPEPSPPPTEPEPEVVEEPEVKLPPTPEPESIPPKPPSPSKNTERKERWRAEHQSKKQVEEPKLPELPDFTKRKIGDWIYGDDDFSTSKPDSQRERQKRQVFIPDIEALPKRTGSAGTSGRAGREGTLIEAQPVPTKPRWGKAQRDTSLRDMLERERLAEERRAKALKMLEKLRKNNLGMEEEEEVIDPLYLEDSEEMTDGWLSKFCILPRYLADAYAKTFEIVDEAQVGWLSPLDTILALRAANRDLTTAQEEFVYRVLQITGYDITKGADVKLFSILAALSHKITSLDEWMKNLVERVDFDILEMKLFMCRSLWECCVDPDTNTISIDQLCVELRAGGVSLKHEREVRICLKEKDSLDLLDFLTYVPLFIMIHTSVVDNPLDDTRDK